MAEKFQALLRGEVVANSQLEEAFEIVRSRSHGHVAVVLGTLRHLKLEQVVCSRRSRNRNLVVAMIVARNLAKQQQAFDLLGIRALVYPVNEQ